MHALVYFALTHGVFSRTHHSECASPINTIATPRSLTAAAADAVTNAGSGLRTTAGKIALSGERGGFEPVAPLAGTAMGSGSDQGFRGFAEALEGVSPAAGVANVLHGTGRIVASGARRLTSVVRPLKQLRPHFSAN